MPDELKPCPFCGGTNIHLIQADITIYAACDNPYCGAEGAPAFADFRAVELWNTRPLEAAAEAAARSYRAALVQAGDLVGAELGDFVDVEPLYCPQWVQPYKRLQAAIEAALEGGAS